MSRVRLFAGLIGLSLAGGLSLNVVPLMSGAFMAELGLTAAQVGSVLSVQIFIGSAIGILLSTRMYLLSPRSLGFLAILCVVAATVAFAFVSSFAAVIATSAIIGLAMGVVGACGAAAIATVDRVDRTAAIVSVGVTVLVAGLTLPISHAADSGGRRALFLADAVAVALSALLVLALPRRQGRTGSHRPLPFLGALVSPLVFASTCLQIGSIGVWVFTERIGVGAGLTTKSVGEIIAGSTLLGIMGGVCAAMVARAGQQRLWAMIGTAAFGISAAAIAISSGPMFFVVAMCAQAFLYVFTMPFITAVAIDQDRSGGLAVAASGWSNLIGAGAPALAGMLARSGEFENLAWLALVSTAFSVVGLAMVGRAVRRKPAFARTQLPTAPE